MASQYIPREQFVDFHQRRQRFALMVCHRRAGKSVACVNELVIRAVRTRKRHARYAYVAPFRQQAKEIAWTYLKDATDGLRVGTPRESELRVKLPNDAWITLYGADNPNALRGLYFDGLILDEFGDMKPSLMGEVILPCLADRQGWLAIIGTAKGRNQFYQYKVHAQEKNSGWFYKMVRASESGIIPQSELDNLHNTMTEAQYEQEMECSFDAAIQGTYYADMINRLDAQKRLVRGDCLYDANQKVHVAADLGLRDSTAWWFWQPRSDGIAIINYYEASGKFLDHYIGMLHDTQYEFHEIWLPHDAKTKTLATRRSTVEQLRIPSTVRPDLYGRDVVLPVRIVPKMKIQHGIDAARLVLTRCWFDMDRCERGLDTLRSYRRKYNEITQSYSDVPLHDWASNGADAFRYLALVADQSVGRVSEGDNPGAPAAPSDGNGLTLDKLYEENKNAWRKYTIRL